MSMRGWSERGYGYPLFTADNLPKIIDFIIKNDEKEYTPEEIEGIKESEGEFDLEDCLGEPVSWKVASIINRLEGVSAFLGYQSCGDTNTDSHIGAGMIWPWDDDRLSKEKADEILKKYADILGITEEPDYFDLEYFG